MASWSQTVTLDKNRPSIRVVPDAVTGCKLRDFWDDTNKRYKSGVMVVTVTSITWTGGATGETLSISVQPPNYNALNDTQAIYTPDAAAHAWGGTTYKNVAAVNYGRPGPSAVLEPDGTITLLAVDLALASNAFTDVASTVVVTVAGTATFTEYSPYAAVGGTAKEIDLTAGPLSYVYLTAGSAGAWGMVTQDIMTGYGAVVVQLDSLVTGLIPGTVGGGAQFQLTNPAQAGGSPLAALDQPVPRAAQKTTAFADNYTYVFAVNNNLIDTNATQVGTPAGTAYNLCNAGVQAAGGNDGDTATAVLSYHLATHTL
jgi:hypothetical protein